MIRASLAWLGFVTITWATLLNAQNTTAPAHTGKAQIVGVVVDSLNGRYLSGADIVIEGVRSAIQTDSVGRFQIDGLSPGTYQVGVFHPVLDTLDLTILTRPFHVGPDSSSVVILAIPSAATLVRRSCSELGNAKGRSAVIGHVNDPETLQPVARAEVSIAWSEIEVSRTFGIRQTPHVIRDTTSAAGAFTFCGLPNSLQATLQARRGWTATAEIPISLGERPVELLARTILLSSSDSTTRRGSASLSGQVLLEGNPTNAMSRVELLGTDIVAMTDEKGKFTMHDLPSGTRVVVARHLGFAADAQPVDLSSLKEQKVTLKLPKFVAVMDPVLVTARRFLALDKIGFNQRQKSGFGYYMGPDRLSKINPNFLTDIFRQVPGLRVTYTRDGDVVSSSRGGSSCVQYWVDDMPFTEMTPGEINHFVNGREVVAVEVYQTNAPGQYILPGGGDCATIVLWTRFKIGS